MKYAFATAALAAAVSAQSLSDIPSCALPCIDAARSSTTTCTADDYACICDNVNSLTTAATPCVLSDCGATVAATEVLPAVQAFCAAVSASATVATSTATTAATSATLVATTTAAYTTPVSSTLAVSKTVTSAAGYPTSAISNSTYTTTQSSPTTVVTAGAAMATAGSIGMIILGALAAL